MAETKKVPVAKATRDLADRKRKHVDVVADVVTVDLRAIQRMSQGDREAAITRAYKLLSRLVVDPHGDHSDVSV